MSDLAAQVRAVLARTVLPSVIARGGAIRVAAAGDGVVTLEVSGSPGAVFPLASRIEAAIRAAVPQVTAVRLVTPGAGPSAGRRRGPPPIWRRPPGRCWTPRSIRRSPPTAAT